MTGRPPSTSRAAVLRAALASDLDALRVPALDTVRGALKTADTLPYAARALRVSLRTLQRLVRDFPAILDQDEQGP